MKPVVRVAAAGLTVMLLASPSAWAISPPVVEESAAPPSGSTGPAVPMTQRTECVTTGVLPGTLDMPGAGAAPAQTMLNLSDAWRFSRGEGQTVAVIDTGVRRGPRLPNVEPGGDYVANTDGLTDCDGHGTLIAGIIAGQPGDDAFSGVAPGARVLAIRQTSSAFAPRTPTEDPALARAAIDTASLARAVVHAADQGASVINISTVTCLPADNTVDQAALGAALRYAAVDKDVVIVAAAGNAAPSGLSGGAACESNPLNGSGSPGDPRDWAGVTSVSSPSWWQPYVLSVGSTSSTGQPSAFTMAGPWLGIAAPGENVVSLSNGDGGGLANGMPGGRGELTSLSGTSYAAAYVSGAAALVRSRFPDLTAAQVIDRLTATAHRGAQAPSNVIGAGSVDPVAALTWQLPDVGPTGPVPAKHIAAPALPAAENHTSRTVAFAGAAALLLVVGATAFAAHRRKEQDQ
ncbi:type VII secretion-associated serine protease mycosin [Mycolicibacterium komossense]|uniref:Type VII secretion-associated serine protease mycosin n=1 Tax=Mycolicibacterium komossense TaxID=1779 RepID=A0ABT3CFK6_9MYCO|nr:type VII secretion-associated serine protease mycosin [Mycolicibacterium komossense]MCV7228263.1 type VII secretion-associated serine protease mycosin [Mycolicibacterium komossense]